MSKQGVHITLIGTLLGLAWVFVCETTSMAGSMPSMHLTAIAIQNLKDDKDEKEESVPTPQVPVFKPGSADEAVYNFCVAIADDDTATASDYISKSAKGIAEKLREGELGEDRIDELKSFMIPMTELQPTPIKGDNSKRSLRNRKSQTMSFTLKKENEIYRITDISFTKPKK